MHNVTPGQLYYHYKHFTHNPKQDPFFMCYRIIGLSVDAAHEYAQLVIYEPIMYYDHLDSMKASFYSRDIDNFFETINYKSYKGSRFQLIEDGVALSKIHSFESLEDDNGDSNEYDDEDNEDDLSDEDSDDIFGIQ